MHSPKSRGYLHEKQNQTNIARVWDDICPQKQEVDRYKLVWFFHHILGESTLLVVNIFFIFHLRPKLFWSGI